MTQAMFDDIKLEGVLDTSDLKDLNEEDLGNTFTNMCRTPTTVTAGIVVPVQGINVSAKSQKDLIVASISARQ